MIFRELGWRDGEILNLEEMQLPSHDRTLLYGLGAFETFCMYGQTPFLLDRHLERLGQSLSLLGLPTPSAVEEVSSGVPDLAQALEVEEGVIRLTVTAGADGAGRGGMKTLMHVRDIPPAPLSPVKVGLADYAPDSRSPISGVKSTSYLIHYLLRTIAEENGRLDDLMVDHSGHVTEGTVSNVFAVRQGQLVTPPVSEGILPGVTRGVVVEIAESLGLSVEEASLSVEDLSVVEECFLTGAIKGLVPVDVLIGRELEESRPVSRQLLEGFVQRVNKTCGVALSLPA
ncbi:MAG: aminotransferase class IV [Planctomycetota bacterium]|nr:aminotransferase class IV [Planctomycetota bacterium]